MPELNRKSTAGLTALGVVCVAFGAMSVVTCGWAALQPTTIAAETQFARAPQIQTRWIMALQYADAGLNLVLAGLLFAAGVGLLRLRVWGKKLAEWYAVARIILSVIEVIITLTGPLANLPSKDQLGPSVHQTLSTRFYPAGITIALAGLALSVLLPVVLLCLLSRKSYTDNLS